MKGLVPAILLFVAVATVAANAAASGNQWHLLVALVNEHGLVAGGATIFFFGAHWWIYRLYEGRIADAKASADARVSDRQKEIDRLLAENSEYRDRFFKLLDGDRIQRVGEE